MRSSVLCVLAATVVSAAPGLFLPALLAPPPKQMSSTPSVSPAQQATFDAVQRGYGQFAPLISSGVFNALASTLAAIAPGKFVPASQPIVLAFNAAALAASQADGTALELALQCVNAIILANGLSPGSTCVNSGKNTVATYQVAFDTVLEQFVGIVPPSTLAIIQAQVAQYFQNLGVIPPVAQMNTNINNALISVVAQASAETVTAIERMQGCFNQALANGNVNTAQNCYQSSGAMTSYQNVFNGIANQFVGILPATASEDLVNTYSYFLSQNGATAGINQVNLINQGILSVAAAFAGNGATALIQIQTCFSSILMGAAPAQTSSCFVRQGGPISTLETIVVSILNTGFGTLPPSLVISTGQQISPMFEQASPPTASAVRLAIQSSFNTVALTPAALSCSLAILDCVNIVLLSQQGDCFALPKCSPVIGTGLNIIPRP